MATSSAPASPELRRPTEPRANTAIDGADDVATLDGVAFDSSLSFLDDASVNDSSPFNREAPLPMSPPLSGVVDDDETMQLLGDLLSLAAKDGGVDNEQQRDDDPFNSSTSNSSEQLDQRPQLKSKSALSRQRQREEIEYLREQMGHLEVWEAIAKRQLSEKQRAKIENVKLRELLEGQLRIAKSLEELLRKRSLANTDTFFSERKRSRGASRIGLAANCDLIRSRIERRFEDVEPVFAQIGLSNTVAEMDDVRVVSGTDDAIFMEMLMVKSFPFRQPDVSEAVWQCVCNTDIPLNNGFYEASGQTSSTCEFKLAVALRLRRAEAVIHVQGVAAHRVEKARSVIDFETVGATDGALFAGRDIVTTECGYIVIEQGPLDPHGDPSTVVKVCVRMWPEMENADPEGGLELQTGLYVDLVIGLYNENVKSMLQITENTLLEQLQRASHA